MTTTIAIIDYGSGNLRSAAKALEAAASLNQQNVGVCITADPKAIAGATHVVLPGVGAFAACWRGVNSVPGLREAMEDHAINQQKPFLGICVGMQLLAERGHEHETCPGLGWIAGDVRRITPSDASLKIPHMGWNTLETVQPHTLLEGVDGRDVYFVHSYHFEVAEPGATSARTTYGGPITAMIARGSVAGVQFHPEKSQRAGLSVLQQFIRWRP